MGQKASYPTLSPSWLMDGYSPTYYSDGGPQLQVDL